MRTYISFGLILRDIPNSITPQTPSACYRPRSHCLYLPVQTPPPPPPPSFFPLSWTEEPTKTGTCSHDRRALQQLALNVHVKHWPDLTSVTLSLRATGTPISVCTPQLFLTNSSSAIRDSSQSWIFIWNVCWAGFLSVGQIIILKPGCDVCTS